MVWAPDSTDLWLPDPGHPDRWAPDSRGKLTLGRAVELFLAAKAADGTSPRTIEWYRMITVRLVRALGADRSVDGLDPHGAAGLGGLWLMDRASGNGLTVALYET